MKRLTDDDIRIAPSEVVGYGRTGEVGTHKGVTYGTIDRGITNLLRVARNAHECVTGCTIQPGDVYSEELANGSHDSGSRLCVAHAVERGLLVVNPTLVRWDRESQEWVAVK